MIWLLLSAGAVLAACVLLWPWRARWQALAGAATLLALSLALYASIGAPRLLPVITEHGAAMAQLDARVEAAQDKLSESPENLRAWAELGQVQMERGDFTASAEAYRRAVLLSGGEPVLILQYAKAQIFEANGNVTEAARKGLAIVRAAEPENPEALYFLALADAQDGNVKRAMPVFKKLYRTLPEDSPIRKLLARQIGAE